MAPKFQNLQTLAWRQASEFSFASDRKHTGNVAAAASDKSNPEDEEDDVDNVDEAAATRLAIRKLHARIAAMMHNLWSYVNSVFRNQH